MRQNVRMKQIDRLRTRGLFDSRVPRYTSYPTAPVFSRDIGAQQQGDALAALNPAEPVSVYLHIPFCERLCWFCACQTQGTRSLSPERFGDLVHTSHDSLEILAEGRPLTRIIASAFDARTPVGARYSQAS